MNKRKLSLLFTVSLTAMGSIHSSSIIWNNALGRHINSITGKIVKTRGVLAPYSAVEPYSAIEPFSAVATRANGTAKSFFDGAYAMVGAGVTGIVSGAQYLYGSEETAEQSAMVEPAIVESVRIEQPVGEQSATGSVLTESEGNFITNNPLLAGAIFVGASRIAWNVWKAKSNFAATSVDKTEPALEENPVAKAAEQGCQATAPRYTSAEQGSQTITSESVAAPVVKQAAPVVPVIKQAAVAPVVKQAPVVKKPTVDEIVKNCANDVQGLIHALRSNGYTKTHATTASLKQFSNLNDGQTKFVLSKI